MAKIIYWESPIDPTKKIEYLTKGETLFDVLLELGIEREPLSVILNGEIPNEIPLNARIHENDIIEIRRIVQGGSSESKNTWATVISIVALVASVVLTAGFGLAWWAAGVSLIGGIASGALKYRAAKLAMRNTGQSQSEVSVETNNLSITSAQNEARPLQPLQLPMGSVRCVPDFHSRPYPSFWGGELAPTARTVFGAFKPAPNNPQLWPDEIPVGFFATSPYNWPAYPMKIEPSYDLADITSMTTAQRQDFAPQFFVGPLGSPSKPVLLYHGDPADPYYGRITNLAVFALQGTSAANATQAQTDYLAWHDYPIYFTIHGTYPSWWPTAMTNVYNNNRFRWKLSSTKIRNYINASPGNPLYNSLGNAITLYMFGELNKTIMAPYVHTTTGFVTFEETILANKYDSSPNQAVTHIFNYGLGDLTVSDKRVEKTLVSDIAQAEVNPLDKDDWDFPILFPIKSRYYIAPRVLEGATLNNNIDFEGPTEIVQPTDLNTYNFVHRVTPVGTQWVEIDFEGQCYTAGSSGLEMNSVTFEIQYKLASATEWEVIQLLYFFNGDTQVQRYTHTITSNFSTWPSTEIEFRIRKKEADTVNNNGTQVAQFSMTAFKCFLDESAIDLTAQNMEGLFLVANTQTSGSSNKYSVQIDSKCWIYDEDTDTWSWDFSRNPAWWYLYFARGGFKNPLAEGTYTFPWSPTYGWVNGPGHPDNTEFLFGCGMTDDKIDIDKIKEWAVFCDENDIFIDIVFSDNITEFEILEKIANIGRGSVSYYNGLLSVVYEDSQQVPVGLYGMGNIIEGTFTADYSVANVPSKVIGNYSDRDNDWEVRQVECDVPFADTNNLNYITTTLDGITTESQAQREVNILAARQFFQKRTYSWRVDKEGLLAKRGDLVYLSHDSTQYGWSGRITKFILDSGSVIGVETTAEFRDIDISHITIRKPNGDLQTYECSVSDCNIMFEEEFAIEDAPYYPVNTNESINIDSIFPNSFADDYIFIAGPMETPGKIVRISQIEPDENMNFAITAIDEDPAMWSYEYGPAEDPESFDDSVIVSRVFNTSYSQLEDGFVKVMWETDGADYVMIRNNDTGLLLSSGGLMSFSKGEVVLELVKGVKYNLNIEPFVIGSPYKQKNVSMVVWA